MIEMVYTEQKEMRWSVENEIILWIMWKSWCWDLEEIEIWQRHLAKKVHAHVYKSFTLFLTFLPQISTTIHVQCMFFKKCTFVVWELHLH